MQFKIKSLLIEMMVFVSIFMLWLLIWVVTLVEFHRLGDPMPRCIKSVCIWFSCHVTYLLFVRFKLVDNHNNLDLYVYVYQITELGRGFKKWLNLNNNQQYPLLWTICQQTDTKIFIAFNILRWFLKNNPEHVCKPPLWSAAEHLWKPLNEMLLSCWILVTLY